MNSKSKKYFAPIEVASMPEAVEERLRKYLNPFLFGYIKKERSKWPIEFTENLNSKQN